MFDTTVQAQDQREAERGQEKEECISESWLRRRENCETGPRAKYYVEHYHPCYNMRVSISAYIPTVLVKPTIQVRFKCQIR